MKKRFQLTLLIVYAIFCIIISHGKRITIRSNEMDSFPKLGDIITNNQDDEELIVYFVDDVYDMSVLPADTLLINVINKVKFLGNENGTVFNYNYDRNGIFKVSINSVDRDRGELFTLENIIFEKYKNDRASDGIQIMFVVATSDNFQFLVKNCTFRDNEFKLFRIDVRCSKNYKNTRPFLLFDHCNFINNKHRISYAHNENHIPNAVTLRMQDCYFENNRGLFYSYSYMIYNFDRCHFIGMNMDTDELTHGAFFSSLKGNDTMIITNSVFEDINITKNFPMIEGISYSMEIDNTTFSNCRSDFGFLFDIKNMKKGYHINISNAVFENTCGIFTGLSNEYTISNTSFKNVVNQNALPAISNSKNAKYNISNSIFSNFTINKALFNEETTLIFDNVNIENIRTNSNPVFYSQFNDLIFNNVDIQDIFCLGSGGDTSLFYFDSGENTNTFSLKNVKIKNSISNNSFIKINGDHNEIIIDDTTIDNIMSYGSVIDNKSINTKVTISNLNFYNNINSNKLDCGNIYFKDNIDLSISNSKFVNNLCKNNGGAICMENIESMEFHLISNTFNKNYAVNGGALYLKENQASSINKTIIIEDNIFNQNIAENFGGAIYSQLNNVSAKNNNFTFNAAGINGGGIYTENFAITNISDEKYFYLKDNVVDSVENDYSSKPSYITLNTTLSKKEKQNYYSVDIIPGDYLPLKFTLYDVYDKILKDTTKFYSSITLKVLLINNNNDNDYDETNYWNSTSTSTSLLGNIGSFVNGQCELNNLKIYAEPNEYKLNILIENYNDDIEINIPEIRITVNDCKENQIRMFDKNNILYCENPICKDSCPVGDSASCVPFYKEKKNDKIKNICKCDPAWEGLNCENKIFINYSIIEKINYFLIIPTIIVIAFYIVFILCNRKLRIIKDTGLIKIITISIGMIIYLSSISLINYTTNIECTLNFALKHTGISMILFVFYIYITQSYILGVQIIKKDKRKNFIISIVSASKFENETKDKQNEETNQEVVKSNEDINKDKNDKTSVLKSSSEFKFSNAPSVKDSDVNTTVCMKEKEAFSSLIEALFVYIVFIIIIISISVYHLIKHENDLTIIKNKKYWIYKSELDHIDLILNLLSFLFLIALLIRGKKTVLNDNIFIFIKYIVYSIVVIITLGPLINIIGYSALSEQHNERIIFETILNFVGYVTLFILFSWDKIYYIIKKKGNERDLYFMVNVNDPTINKDEFLEMYEKCSIRKLKSIAK